MILHHHRTLLKTYSIHTDLNELLRIQQVFQKSVKYSYFRELNSIPQWFCKYHRQHVLKSPEILL